MIIKKALNCRKGKKEQLLLFVVGSRRQRKQIGVLLLKKEKAKLPSDGGDTSYAMSECVSRNSQL